MAQQTQHNSIDEVLALLNQPSNDSLRQALTILFNAAMFLERQQFLNAEPYERTPNRHDYANGFKPRSLQTRVGQLNLQLPQVRKGDFYPSALERGTRSERALKLAVAEMYVQGVSTRKVAAITEQLCGFEITSSQVSRATAELDEVFAQWRERALGPMPYVQMDARYDKVREGGVVIDEATLIAIGIDLEGKRHILGTSVERSEAEVHWRSFFQSLVKRGLCGVELITSDAHTGLSAARQAVFPSVAWQRCQFHLQQNASQYVVRLEQRGEVARELRSVLNAPNREEAERLLSAMVKKYETSAPRLSVWLEGNVSEGLTVFAYPKQYQLRLRTSNLSERINRELKRRTRVVGVFPNGQSLERLVTAILMEIDEDWQSGSRYLPVI
jgi:putative transposase